MAAESKANRMKDKGKNAGVERLNLDRIYRIKKIKKNWGFKFRVTVFGLRCDSTAFAGQTPHQSGAVAPQSKYAERNTSPLC